MRSELDKSILVIGGGIAGLSTALRLADAGHRVAVLTKTALSETASFRAQGGIAAVMAEGDSLQSHQSDTVRAGAGLCHGEIVEQVIREGPDCIRWLEHHGVRFTRSPEGTHLHLTREGGHSHRRIVHADDATGRAIMGTLAARVRQHEAIELLENRFVVDLVTSSQLGLSGPNRCVGMTVLDDAAGSIDTLWASAVVLATGGSSGVYRHSTNASTGDGIAMAWRAGCGVSNMEFVQFHPTCLFHPRARSVLISEALRGEGARLELPDGTPFMHRYDERGELAPRDIVSRAIAHEMTTRGLEHVLLDISHEPAAVVRERFPNILRVCAEFGFDLTREPIPVVPAAHYTCGGVVTDSQGQTDINQLYAVGEISFTGLHGANRLASNSLLEALAFAKSTSGKIDEQVRQCPAETRLRALPGERFADDTMERSRWRRRAAELRRVMSGHVGIVRTQESLATAADFLDGLERELEARRAENRSGRDLLELRNLVAVARLITESAIRRRESRGLHYVADFPQRDAHPEDSALRPGR